MKGTIKRIVGPVVIATGFTAPQKNHLVEVGEERLIGEIIQISGNNVIIQVYEETSGIGVSEPVINLNRPFTLRLGPGVMGNVFDGLQRPLEVLEGNFMKRGVQFEPLSLDKKWHFIPREDLKPGSIIEPGIFLGTVQETKQILHHIMVPPNIRGTLGELTPEGDFKINQAAAVLEDGRELFFYQDWSIRKPRPFKWRLDSERALITGQRVLDFLFPLVEGGAAMIPGGFGSGKTVLERTIAKYSSTDIMVLTLCGERGNEAAEAIKSFMGLEDPRTGLPMIERTAFIVNTSNMPVAARESSIYAGITLAEYYRDMGYSVSLLADSTSRWAEALRELSGRLGEIPGEEGFPSSMPKLLGEFYERSGRVRTLSGNEGSVTVIGAVSPQGGDFSEPVTQYTMRFTSVNWALDSDLAYSRHYPAISWSLSYSQNMELLDSYFKSKGGKYWIQLRGRIKGILQTEENLLHIVRLIGKDTLSESQKGFLLTGEIVREGFLQQNAFSDEDAFSSINKTYQLASIIVNAHDQIQKAIRMQSLSVDEFYEDPIIEELKRLKEKPVEEIVDIIVKLNKRIHEIGSEGS